MRIVVMKLLMQSVAERDTDQLQEGIVTRLGKKKKKTAKSVESFSEIVLAVSDESIIQESQSHLCFCCGYGGNIGRIWRIFSGLSSSTESASLQVNMSLLCDVVKECRESVMSKMYSEALYNWFISKLFTQSIESVVCILQRTCCQIKFVMLGD